MIMEQQEDQRSNPQIEHLAVNNDEHEKAPHSKLREAF